MTRKFFPILLGTTLFISSCGGSDANTNTGPAAAPSALSQVPAVRLNFRYEADVPGPAELPASNSEERNAAVQSHFDQNRPQEVLDRTVTSPDKKHIAAV